MVNAIKLVLVDNEGSAFKSPEVCVANQQNN